jgi:hypothetical protein
MPVRQEHQRLIALSVPGSTARGSEELLDLIGRQVLAGASLGVLSPARRGNFPIYGSWCGASAEWQLDDFTHGDLCEFPVFGLFREGLKPPEVLAAHAPRSVRLKRF